MIQHVTNTIRPQTVEACIEFYSLLGFTRIAPPPSLADRSVWLAPPGVGTPTQLHLLLDADAVPSTGHIAVWPHDFGATVAALKAAGHSIQPRTAHWGARRIYVRDPSGNTVELLEQPPAAPE